MGKHDRPTLLSILAILEIIGAVIVILGGLAFTFVIGLSGTSGAGPAAAIFGSLFLGAGALYLLWGLGLWKGWKWIWYLSVILLILGLIGSIGSTVLVPVLLTSIPEYYNGTTDSGLLLAESITSTIIGLAINIVLLWYFFKKDVKAYFGV